MLTSLAKCLWRRVTLCALALGVISTSNAVPIAGRGTWESTLFPRDLNGDGVFEAWYDSTLNITWRDWKDGKYLSGDWPDPLQLSSRVIEGRSGWRLPRMVDTGAPGCDHSIAGGTDCGYNVDTSTSELAHLYYVTLGNLAFCQAGADPCVVNPVDFGPVNTGPFSREMSGDWYWFGTRYSDPNLPPGTELSWIFFAPYGYQTNASLGHNARYLLILDGDATATPVSEPSSALLMLIALFGGLKLMRGTRYAHPRAT